MNCLLYVDLWPTCRTITSSKSTPSKQTIVYMSVDDIIFVLAMATNNSYELFLLALHTFPCLLSKHCFLIYFTCRNCVNSEHIPIQMSHILLMPSESHQEFCSCFSAKFKG